MRLLYLVLVTCACGPISPPRATVQPGTASGVRNAVLALPTRCEATADDALCNPQSYYSEGTENLAPRNSFAEMIEPIVRLKLELAGYTLVDARTLRLEEVGRTETTTEAEQATGVVPTVKETERGTSLTVAELSPADQAAAAGSLGLAGVVESTLRITRAEHYRARLELVLSLRALPGGEVLWTARCAELYEDARATAELVATCVGDGVLAWRAPDAIIGGAP